MNKQDRAYTLLNSVEGKTTKDNRTISEVLDIIFDMSEGATSKMEKKDRVRGHASIFIELKDGRITVDHGTEKVLLAGWTAQEGDWDILWQVIHMLEAGNAVSMKEF